MDRFNSKWSSAAVILALLAACDSETNDAVGDASVTQDAAAAADGTAQGGDGDSSGADASELLDGFYSGSSDLDSSGADTAPAPLPTVVGPPEAVDLNPDPRVVEVELLASVIGHEYIDGQAATVWAYNGQVPGPTIHARKGDRVIVHFTNKLDHATTVHWHGMRVPNAMDGGPLSQPPIEPGQEFTYDFVVPDAGTFWYHPHMMTPEAVERGLYGTFVVHEEDPPAFDAERVLFLDDVLLTETGQLAPFWSNHMTQMHGRNGNTLLVNGQIADGDIQWSMQRGAVERWRVLNSANARVARLSLEGLQWRVIGKDVGLIPEPYSVAGVLEIAPGERYELEVVWPSDLPQQQATASYWVPTLEDDEVVLTAIEIVEILPSEAPALPAHEVTLPLVELPYWPLGAIDLTLELDGWTNADNSVTWAVNGEAYDPTHAIVVEPNRVYHVRIDNVSVLEHPYHIHGHSFQVMLRDGKPANEPGLQDTVLIPGESSISIAMVFDNPGKWMHHCHILEHVGAGMMGVIEVPAANP